MIVRPRRSALYMPGSNGRALEKARGLDADALILDLEDSVAPDAKDAARAAVMSAVRAGGFGGREIVVRINALDGPWGPADIEAAAAARPDAVLIPKVGHPDTLRAARARLDAGGAPATALWAMIETPAGLLGAEAIARAGHGLAVLVVGTNDIAKETRARQVRGRAPMLPWLMQVVLAARAGGLDVLDGVCNDLEDMDALDAECRQGLDMGMDGKTLIHPRQIDVANAVFAPSADDVAAARAILAAFARPENAGRGVIALDGRMVERLHADMATRTVALAEAIAARG